MVVIIDSSMMTEVDRILRKQGKRNFYHSVKLEGSRGCIEEVSKGVLLGDNQPYLE